MKTRIAFLSLALSFIWTGALCAQDGGDKVNVPLTDPSRPARIHADLLFGGIVVRGANTKAVVVETRRASHDGEPDEPPVPPNASGMHRLDLGANTGLDIVEQDNVVTIKTTAWGRHADLVITVPHHSALQLKTVTGGDIDVEQVDGEIDVDALNGKISLSNVSGSVLAHSLNGAIHATIDQVDPGKPMSFSTLNGEIDVTLPSNVRANVRMKTDNGDIYSDFDVKLEPGAHTVSSDSDSHGGAHRIRVDRTLRGTINGGGPEYQFTSFNGQMFIRKQK